MMAAVVRWKLFCQHWPVRFSSANYQSTRNYFSNLCMIHEMLFQLCLSILISLWWMETNVSYVFMYWRYHCCYLLFISLTRSFLIMLIEEFERKMLKYWDQVMHDIWWLRLSFTHLRVEIWTSFVLTYFLKMFLT